MAGLFDKPTLTPTAVPNPADTANRLNDALTRRLQAGGTNADTLSPGAPLNASIGARPPTLTGIN